MCKLLTPQAETGSLSLLQFGRVELHDLVEQSLLVLL